MTIQPPDSQNGDGSSVGPAEKVFSSIQAGDVIIFEAEDFLGKCIAWITDSSVSHAAMVYDNSAASETMVEMGKGGIGNNLFAISDVSLPGYEKVHFMRYTQDLSAGRLTKVADRYREEGIQYDCPSLVLLRVQKRFGWPPQTNCLNLSYGRSPPQRDWSLRTKWWKNQPKCFIYPCWRRLNPWMENLMTQ